MRYLRFTLRLCAAVIPVGVTLVYGLLVTSPAGEAAGDYRLQVEPDPRVELAAILGRLSGDRTIAWPDAEFSSGGTPAGLAQATDLLLAQATHPAVLRVRGWMSRGFTTEMLVRLLCSRTALSGVGSATRVAVLDRDPAAASLQEMTVVGRRRRPASVVTGDRSPSPLDLPPGITPEAVDSLLAELPDFAKAVDFDKVWIAISPRLEARARDIASDPTLQKLAARLADFLGEPAVRRPVIVPTWFGPWKAPFGLPHPERGEVRVIDRPASTGRGTPETSLSWVCVKEFARPTLERMARVHAARTRVFSGYWDYFRQGVAATTTTGWEDCLNAHLFRAIDLRVRPERSPAERDMRITSAFQAGLGMIRVVDAAMTRFDQSRGFYRRFTDYYPTLLESLVGLEARIRVRTPELGVRVMPAGPGLKVETILAGQSAAGSDLEVGDIIITADSRPLETEQGLCRVVQSHALGDTLALVVKRGGRWLPVRVALTSGRTEYEFFRSATPALEPLSERIGLEPPWDSNALESLPERIALEPPWKRITG